MLFQLPYEEQILRFLYNISKFQFKKIQHFILKLQGDKTHLPA